MYPKAFLVGLLLCLAVGGFAQQLASNYGPRLRNLSDELQLAATPDGGILVYGYVDYVDGRPTGMLTKLTQDNQPFPGFNTVYGDGWIQKVAVKSNGQLLVMGTFTQINGTPKTNFARLNSDGTLDPSFDVVSDAYTFEVQSDDKIVIANYNTGLTRVNADGSLDPSFTPHNLGFYLFNSGVAPDDKIYVASPTHLMRLTANGALDNTFPALEFNNTLSAIKVLPNGNVILGGEFTQINGVANAHVVIITAQGAIVPTFVAPEIVNGVYTVESKGDNIIIGGNMSSIDGIYAQAAELLPTGEVAQFLVQAYPGFVQNSYILHGKITLTGFFTVVNNVYRPAVVQLNDDYTFNDQFKPDITYASGWDYLPSSVIDSNDKLTVFGGIQANFKFLGAYDNNTPIDKHLIRFNSHGSIDAGITISGADATELSDAAIQPDNKILLGGYFWIGSERFKLIRIMPDGTVDPSFVVNTPISESIDKILVHGTNIIVGGNFTSINGVPATALAVLDFDGNVVMASTSLPSNAWVRRISVQQDGKILVYYDSPGSVSVVRLNTDGTMDNSFAIGAVGGQVTEIIPDAAGKIYLTGSFDTYNGVIKRKFLRLNSNGSIDNTFLTGSSFGPGNPMAMIMMPNGKLMVGGYFTSYRNLPVNGFAVINTDGTLDQTISFGFNPGTVVHKLSQRAESIYVTGRIIQDDFQHVTSIAKLSFGLPNPATTLTATVNETGTVTLAWSDASSNEDGFYIERSEGNPNSFQLVQSVPAGTTSYQEAVDPHITYYYKVRSYNSAGAMHGAGPISILWDPLPLAPNLLMAGVSGKIIHLSWQDNSITETGYIVQRKEASETLFIPIDTLASNAVWFTDLTAQYSMTYSYQVAAVNDHGVSAFSNSLTVSTLTVPNAPIQLSGSADDNTVQLSWVDNSDNETGFVIQRKELLEPNFISIDTVLSPTVDFVDGPLDYNKTYLYRVASLNAAGASAFSNDISLLTLTTPIAPVNLTITFSGGEATLQWDDQSDNEAGFLVERTSGTGAFSLFATVPAANSEVFVDQSAGLDETYSYRVAAFNNAGTSDYSNVAEIPIVTGMESEVAIRFFPNPVSTSLTIQFESSESCIVHVFNGSGQKTHMVAKENGQYSVVVPFEDASPGIYLINVSNHHTSFKIMKR